MQGVAGNRLRHDAFRNEYRRQSKNILRNSQQRQTLDDVQSLIL